MSENASAATMAGVVVFGVGFLPSAGLSATKSCLMLYSRPLNSFQEKSIAEVMCPSRAL